MNSQAQPINKMNKKSVGILGTGFFVPERVLTNFDLEKIVETNNEWIVERTGIHQRRIADELSLTSDLALQASQKALQNANLSPEDLDLIIVATVSPDCPSPSTASILQNKLKAARAAAFDMSAACSGFVYALCVATQFVQTGFYKKVLVVGAETLSKFINWQDRNTCILFGDGAGAVIVGEVDAEVGILGFDLGSDGSGANLLGISSRIGKDKDNPLHDKIFMNGKEVFKFAVRALPATLERALKKTNISHEKIDWLVPHQANIRIIQSAAKRFHLSMDKVILNIERYGNVSAASIPIALAEANEAKKFQRGDLVALAGFGAGLTWSSCLLKWN